MPTPPRSAPEPIEAVLFDFHSTLVDQGDPRAWHGLDLVLRLVGP